MAHQLGFNLFDLDGHGVQPCKGCVSMEKTGSSWGNWSPEPLDADSPSSHKGLRPDLTRQNTTSSTWPGKFLTVPNSDGELFKFTDSWEEWRRVQRPCVIFVVAIYIFSSAVCRRRLKSEPMTLKS